MPVINCHVSDETMKTLRRLAAERGLTAEILAEAAIETAALRQQREDEANAERFRRARGMRR